MATYPDDYPMFDIREQIVRIDKMQAELQKTMQETNKISREINKIAQETKFATPQMFFQGALAMAALIAAGAALAKLFS